MSRPQTLIVFGAGPGIGNHVATAFAQKGTINHIILLSRDKHRLDSKDRTSVQSASSSTIKVSTLRIDLADLSSLPSALKDLDEATQNEDVKIIFFNAARINPSAILTTSVDEIDQDFKTTNLALYVIAQHYIPRLTTINRSALLVTNSALPWDPVPQLLSLSLVKAAQRNMVQSLRLAYADSGVQIGLITVQGQVSPDEELRNPENIARKTVEFYEGGVESGLEVKI